MITKAIDILRNDESVVHWVNRWIFVILVILSACKKEDNKTLTEVIPCPGIPTVTDADGNVYHTVEIGDQCWISENLRTGLMVHDSTEMSNNNVVEKYCYENILANCEQYGGLYQWDEMMRYTTAPGSQGICPPGWHIPTNEDWKILEGYTDTFYSVSDTAWDHLGWRGSDAGTNLKSDHGWFSNGNGTDMYGFNALPAGYRSAGYGFLSLSEDVAFWTSNYSTFFGMYRGLTFDSPQVRSYFQPREQGFSVRCLKD